MKTKLLSLILSVVALQATATPEADCCSSRQCCEPYWLGADVSAESMLNKMGWKLYNSRGEERDYFTLIKEIGMNCVRFRVWVNPRDGLCSPEDVAQMAERAAALDLEVMIDFHYSDWWADPGKQYIPKQWENYDYDEMKAALAEHTCHSLNLIKQKGVNVKWVQIGNETTNGFLWPMANANDDMEKYAGLTEAGYQAAKEIFPEAICIVHVDCGSDINRYHKIFNGLKTYGAHWDMIGMSVYPYWDLRENLTASEDETLARVIENINTLYAEFGTPLMIVETGYDVMCPNQGKLFMERLVEQSRDNTGGACKGVMYWAPESEGPYPLGAFHDHRPTIILDPFNAGNTR